jgi:hypothetical protein
MNTARIILLCLSWPLFQAQSAAQIPLPQRENTGQTSPAFTVIDHVTVLPMTEGGNPIKDATVVIENGRISSLHGPAPEG